MKKKLFTCLQVILLFALAALAFWGIWALGMQHHFARPELYAPGSSDYAWLTTTLFVLIFLLMPLLESIGGLLTGYRLHRMRILFIEFTHQEKLRIRLSKRFGMGAFLIPPRIDGTSPYKLALLSLPLSLTALAALLLILAGVFWRTGPARALLFLPFACLGVLIVTLLPRRNGTDCISLLLAFRNRDKLRAWECALHVTAALDESKKLMDMPEEWFQHYPAEVADDPYVSNCIINGASRLMRKARFAEAYGMLRPILDLVPSPETHLTIACALLNGAICEALEDLPPMCLSQLEHPSVKYMSPAHWAPRARTAQYARALLLNRDKAEAAALLPAIEKDVAEDQTDGALIRRIQEKAGIPPKEATP